MKIKRDENRREVVPSWVSNMRETGRGRCEEEEHHQFTLPAYRIFGSSIFIPSYHALW